MGCANSVPVQQQSSTNAGAVMSSGIRNVRSLPVQLESSTNAGAMPGIQVNGATLAQDANSNIDLSAFRITLQQLCPIVFMALDTSASMDCRYGGYTLLQYAAAGANRVIGSLPSQSLFNMVGFGDQVYQLFTPFLAPITTRNKAIMRDTINRLRPIGGTALYDTLVTWSLYVLALLGAAEEKGVSFASTRFWFVLLTDGEDTRSRTDLDTACQYMQALSGLGNFVRFVFIGVRLDARAARALGALDLAGGTMSTLRSVDNLDDIGNTFEAISMEISAEQARLRVQNQRPTAPPARLGDPSRNCPGGHGLFPFYTAHDGMVCDACGPNRRHAVGRGQLMYGCRQCDHDVCARHYTA